MIAIYKRELKSYFHSFIGWLFLAVTFMIFGIYFTVYNMLAGYPNISYVFQSVIFIFMFAFPILTMRILAEERKHKTDQLILTAPVSVTKIVVGKYLSLLTIFLIPTVIFGITPLFLQRLGEFEMGVSYTAMLSFFLYGACCLAIGLFISSLTESVIVAAVLTYIVLFLGYIMAGLCGIISSTGNLLTKILGMFDLISPFEEMVTGLLYTPTVVYYLSLILLMITATVYSIHKRRYSIKGKGIKLEILSATEVIMAFAIFVVLYFIMPNLPEKYISVDCTKNKMFTLTETSEEFVKSLQEDVNIYVLAGENSCDEDFGNTLDRIADLNKHINLVYVDTAVNPQFYSKYTDNQPTTNSCIVEGPSRSKVVEYSDIYIQEINYETYQYDLTGYDGEGQIVSAIAYVTTDDMPKIYIVEGHNELSFENSFANAIEKENIDYEYISLLTIDSIPEDCQALIIDAPTSDYSKDDADKVIKYLKDGGKLFVIPTYTNEDMTNFNSILDFYGVSVIDGMIAEGDMDMYYSEPYFLIPYIESDEITDELSDLYVFVPYAQGLSYSDDLDTVSYIPLLSTSEYSYSKADIENALDDYSPDSDIEGPFTIALKAEKTCDSGAASEAVIIASENVFTDAADMIVPGNNIKLFSSIISHMVEHTSSVNIPAKSYDSQLITMTGKAALIVGVVSIVCIPLCFVGIGLYIWIHRRKL